MIPITIDYGWRTCTFVTPHNYRFINLGGDITENQIESTLNHEVLHIVLGRIENAGWREGSSTYLDNVWHGHVKDRKMKYKTIKFLAGLSETGIGFPQELFDSIEELRKIQSSNRKVIKK